MPDKTKLTGGPEKTATWIWLDPETGGQLKIEFYDFSDLAQSMFGNDIAYTITVCEMDKLYAILEKNETSILPWMEQYFKSSLASNNGLRRTELTLVSREKAGHDNGSYCG